RGRRSRQPARGGIRADDSERRHQRRAAAAGLPRHRRFESGRPIARRRDARERRAVGADLSRLKEASLKGGLLCGREDAVPPAFLETVNRLGRPHGISAEFLKLTGTVMGQPSGYRVIVDRISHEVEYFRAYLKHAVLEGTYVINNPFWWTADDKFFNY